MNLSPGLATGSSPLTRGKQRLAALVVRAVRLIPAHAGKTVRRTARTMTRSAHPRSRGENLIGVAADLAAQGSSPLTRGKRLFIVAAVGYGRLIPAHAGKTSAVGRYPRSRAAHPRSRGENFGLEEDSALVDGSSPLTRGKRRDRTPPRRSCRLIPAHAGKTRRAWTAPDSSTAHPRSRGENAASDAIQFDLEGSSPLTRGKPG